MRLTSVCSLFLETKLDQTDTSSDSTISDADQSGDDGNGTTASKKSSKKKKGKQGKKVHVLEGSRVLREVLFYIPHHPSLSNVQTNYFSSAKKKRRASRLSAIEMLERKNERKADLKEKELEQRQREIEFQRQKYEEATERKARLQLELEERRAFMSLLKDKL